MPGVDAGGGVSEGVTSTFAGLVQPAVSAQITSTKTADTSIVCFMKNAFIFLILLICAER
jgi:hypothetical protein